MKFHNLSHPFSISCTLSYSKSPTILNSFFFYPLLGITFSPFPILIIQILTIHIPRYPTKFHLRNKIKKRKPRIQISLPPWTVQPHLASSLQPYGWCSKFSHEHPQKKANTELSHHSQWLLKSGQQNIWNQELQNSQKFSLQGCSQDHLGHQLFFWLNWCNPYSQTPNWRLPVFYEDSSDEITEPLWVEFGINGWDWSRISLQWFICML